MTKKEKNSDSRYPYTYACDLIRNASPWDDNGCIISRATASQIRQIVSMSLGVDDKKVAEKLADMFLKYEPMIHVFNNDTERFEPPENIIAFKIVYIGGRKQAHWLQLKSGETNVNSDDFIREICEKCEFTGNCLPWCTFRPDKTGKKQHSI
ncbi:hypothetical protein KAU33_08745 [Candidatus Dependentiae bacterium]|nr:hypothetical protein [Candidatus Dependentiae bacterium]